MKAPRTSQMRRRRYRIERAVVRSTLALGVVATGLWIFGPLHNLQLALWPTGATVRQPAGRREVVRPAYTRPPSRRVYPFSVIRGGVYGRDDLLQALASDSVAAHHYEGFDAARAHIVAAVAKAVYVSYRRGNNIYWTSRPVALAGGEPLLTDGTNLARARCGNRISTKRMSPTEFQEPPEASSDADSDSTVSAPGANLPPPNIVPPPALVTEIFPPGVDSMAPSDIGGVPATIAAPGGAAAGTPGTYLGFPSTGGMGFLPVAQNGTVTGIVTGSTLPPAGTEPVAADSTIPLPPGSSAQPEQTWFGTVFPPYVWTVAQPSLPPLSPGFPPFSPPPTFSVPGILGSGVTEPWSIVFPPSVADAIGGNPGPNGTPAPPVTPTSSTVNSEFSSAPDPPVTDPVPEPRFTIAVAALLSALLFRRISRRAGVR